MRSVDITLSPEQVISVVEKGVDTGELGSLVSLIDPNFLTDSLLALKRNPKGLSQSTICAVQLLSMFNDGDEHELTTLAQELGVSTATAHRYLNTWVAIGLLYRHPTTRKYRRMPLHRNEQGNPPQLDDPDRPS